MESIALIFIFIIAVAGMLGAFFLGAYVHSHGRDALPFGLKKPRKPKRMTPEREIEIEQGINARRT